MKRKTLKLLLLSFFSIIHFTNANPFVKISKKEIQNFSYAKKRSIYNAYVKFHILDERQSPYLRRLTSTTTKLEAIGEYTSLFFLENSYADQSNRCFYGAYISEIVDSACEHPAKVRSSGYRSSCSAEQFQCNPVLFKRGTCVDNGPHENLANACLKAGKLSKDEIEQLMGTPQFRAYTNAVDSYCSEKGMADANCSRLQNEIGQIIEADDSIPTTQLVNHIDEALASINSSNLPKDCFEVQGVNRCPEVVAKSLENIYAGGIVGNLSYVLTLGEKEFRDPRSICASAFPKDIDIVRLKNELKQRFPNDSLLSDFSPSCEENAIEEVDENRRAEDLTIAPAYMMVDYNAKNEKLQKGINDLLESKATLDATLGENTYSCDDFQTSKTNADRCLDLKGCNLGNANELYQTKLESTKVAVEAARRIQDELTEVNKMIPSGRAYQVSTAVNYEELFAKQANLKNQLNLILDQNPILRGSHFKNIMNGIRVKQVGAGYAVPMEPPSEEQISTALRNQMKDTSKEINTMVDDYQNALNCLNGQSSRCDDFDKVLKRTNYDTTNRILPGFPNLNKFNDFYSCVENSKRSRDEADEVLADVGISIALSFTPFIAVNAIKLAATAGRVLKTAQAASKAKSALISSNIASDVAFTADQASSVYDACKESEIAFLHSRSVENKSCSERVRENIAATNLDRCATQASISAALGIPVALSAFKLVTIPKAQTGVTTEAATSLSQAQQQAALKTRLIEQRASSGVPQNNLAQLRQSEQQVALRNELRERAANRVPENNLAQLRQSEQQVALRNELRERAANRVPENRLSTLAQAENEIAQRANNVTPFTHVGEIVDDQRALVPFKATNNLEGPVYEGIYTDISRMNLLNPPSKALPPASVDIPLALPSPTPGTGLAQRTLPEVAAREGEFLGKAQDVIPANNALRLELDAIEGELATARVATDAAPNSLANSQQRALRSELQERAANRIPENRLATLAQKEDEIRNATRNSMNEAPASTSSLQERAARSAPQNRLATLAQKEDEIRNATRNTTNVEVPPTPTSSTPTLQERAQLALRAVDSNAGRSARRAGQLVYTHSNDNDQNDGEIQPSNEDIAPVPNLTTNENRTPATGPEEDETPPEEGSDPQEGSDGIDFSASAEVTYEDENKAKVTIITSELPSGHTIVYDNSCDASVLACDNNSKEFEVERKSKVNDGNSVVRLMKDGEIVRAVQVSFQIDPKSVPVGGISLRKVKENDKNVELKVVKEVPFDKEHTWFCSNVKIKDDEEARPACSESKGGEKKTFPRKAFSYFVKVKQPANEAGKPDIVVSMRIRKCDSDACLAQDASGDDSGMFMPPTGTNTPPNNLNFNVPKRKIIISPGFL